jgi:carboxyl-terminal processing protease
MGMHATAAARGGRNAALLALGSVLALHGAAAHPQAGELAPTASQAATARLIAEVVAREHYLGEAAVPAGDTLLAHWLDDLDPYRELFTRADVARFEARGEGLVGAFAAGDLALPFEIVAVYRARVAARMRDAQSLLDAQAEDFGDGRLSPRGRDAQWADDTALADHWRRRVRNDVLALELEGRTHDDAVAVLRRRYDELATRAAALTADDVFESLADAYARALDPHSGYFPPRGARRGARPAGPVDGVGVQLETEREYVAIRRLFDGGAADRSGLVHAGDRIVGVGEGTAGPIVDVVGWTLDPVVELIRGAAGSTVRLAILPKGADWRTPAPIVSLARDRVALAEQSPRKRCETIDGLRLCVIAVPRFYIDYAGAGRGGAGYAGTGADVARLLNEERERPPDGLVLDLRGNGGGALLEAARLAGLFVDAGTIVQVRHADGTVERFPDPIPGALYDGPLVVLVDRYSASASEIFAAAIRDYGRGSVVGEHSYGKGTVQETFDLNAENPPTFGQLVLTTAEYFRVTGESVQRDGVGLDLELPPWPGAGDYGERFERNPLPPERVAPAEFARAPDAPLVTADVRARYAARMRTDPRLRAVQSAASGRARAPDASVPLNEGERRRERDARLRADAALTDALRAAAGSRADAAGRAPELLWGELTLQETLHVLADVARPHTAEEND